MSIQPTCIIFLKGVDRNDYKEVEDQFDQLLMDQSLGIEEAIETENNYDIIPSIFTTLDKWPVSTNLHCWTCECTFTSRPVFIPLHIKSISDGSWEMSTRGVFCSFSCAARHITDFMNHLHFTHLYKLYYIFYDKKVSYIYPSPRRYCTKKYSGHMSEGEYIEEIRKLENEIVKRTDSQPPIANDDDQNTGEESEEEISVWTVTG